MYKFILPYSSATYKTIIWERDYIDSDSDNNYNINNNYSIRSDYLSDKQFMDAILTECNDLDNNPAQEIRCGWYLNFLNIFFNNDVVNIESADDYRAKFKTYNSSIKDNVLWLLNNTWQSNR